MNNLKTKLINQAKHDEFKLAIASQPDSIQNKQKQWIPNPFFNELDKAFGRVELMVQELIDDGLLYSAKDFYVYSGKGGVKVHETPKGVRKQLQRIAKNYNLNIVVSDGVLYENDRVSISTDGRIDEIEIIKDQQTLIKGGNIIAPYAVVTVFKSNSEIVAKKFFVIPQSEYQKILQQGIGSYYPTMMAQKSVMKRVASGIYSLLGVALEKEEHEDINDVEDRMNESNNNDVRGNNTQPRQQNDPLEDVQKDEVVDVEATEVDFNAI
jgi:hypothetical protein